MAQKVDLMVIGATDGVSASELTERLVTEFGQPAEVFADLVAAACSGEKPYAAQSNVTLDTANEGREQLEKLGVVCQMLVDGKPIGGNKPAPVQPISEPKAEPAAPPTATPAVESVAEETPVNDEENHLPVEDGMKIVDVNFSDEIGSLGPDSRKHEAEKDPNDEQEEHLPTENGLEVVDINFNDELGSLDEDLAGLKAKSSAGKTEQKKAEPESAEKIELPDPPQDEARPAVQEVKPEAAPESDEKKPDTSATLELSLSDDDSTPLTRPKQKGNTVPDDGGLTLSLDDDAPVQLPKKKPAAFSQPAIGDDISLESEVQPELPEPEVVAVAETTTEDPEPEQPEPKPKQPEPERGEVEETESAAVAAEVDARDTSKERKEEVAPLTEEEAEEPADKEPADKSTKAESEDSETSANQKSEPQVVEQVSGASNPVGSLIAELTSGADAAAPGGLVLPGQAAVSDPEEVEEAVVSSEETPEVTVDEENEPVATLQVQDVIYNDEEEGASGGLVEEAIKKRKIANVTKIAAAAAVVAVVGGGTFFVVNGMSSQQEVVPVVAQAAPPSESSKFDAVEEVSLNAAIERTATVNNPGKFSTEELIAYLSDDIGKSARTELENYVSGKGESTSSSLTPRMGAAIPADSKSVLWLKNRVDHPADKYFDEWSKREIDLHAFLELQERLIEVGDLKIATEVSKSTKDKWFAVMSQQRLARAYHDKGERSKADEVLQQAQRGTYAILSEAERVIAIADYGLTEKSMGFEEDSLDSFLKAGILARNLAKPESKTVALSAIADYYQKLNRLEDSAHFLDMAMETAYELPVNTAARDLAIRQVALTEVRLGLVSQATDHANLIVDPFAAVSTLHGIALELERIGDRTNARLTLNMAYRAGSQIKDSEKRDKLLEKIKLADG